MILQQFTESIICLQGSDTIGWAAGRASGLSKKIGVTRCWHSYLCAVRCKWFACDPDPANATAPPCCLLLH